MVSHNPEVSELCRPAKEERKPRIWKGVSTVVNSTYDGGQVIVLEASQKIACPVSVRYTLEEIVEAPAHDSIPDYRPCSREEAEASPEESQWRCRYIAISDWGGWLPMPCQERDPGCVYEYKTRVRPADEPAAQPEPVAEMTAEQATEWLHSGGTALAVADKFGNVWRYHRGFIRDPNGSTYSSLMPSDAPFAKLLPATQSQVALLAEVERLKANSYVYASAAAGDHLKQTDLEQQLRDVTGSRDAAVAALEVERTRVAALTESTRAIIRCGHAALNETAGKGHG